MSSYTHGDRVSVHQSEQVVWARAFMAAIERKQKLRHGGHFREIDHIWEGWFMPHQYMQLAESMEKQHTLLVAAKYLHPVVYYSSRSSYPLAPSVAKQDSVKNKYLNIQPHPISTPHRLLQQLRKPHFHCFIVLARKPKKQEQPSTIHQSRLLYGSVAGLPISPHLFLNPRAPSLRLVGPDP